jgi:hypothetical protein
MNTFDYITIVIAIIGASLGIINMFYNFNRDRVKLRVIPNIWKICIKDEISERFGIEVINLSTFPVTIRQLGYYDKRNKINVITGLSGFINPIQLPIKLGPRESFSLYGDVEFHKNKDLLNIKCWYAYTICGAIKKSSKKHTKRFLNDIKTNNE